MPTPTPTIAAKTASAKAAAWNRQRKPRPPAADGESSIGWRGWGEFSPLCDCAQPVFRSDAAAAAAIRSSDVGSKVAEICFVSKSSCCNSDAELFSGFFSSVFFSLSAASISSSSPSHEIQKRESLAPEFFVFGFGFGGNIGGRRRRRLTKHFFDLFVKQPPPSEQVLLC